MKRAKKRDENKVEYGTISLPMPLIEKIREKIRGTGMNSVSSYVAFILREVLSSDSKEQGDIREKLKRLGYF